MKKIYIYNHQHELVFVAFAYTITQVDFWMDSPCFIDNNFSYGYGHATLHSNNKA